MTELHELVGTAAFVFVTGKGGTGKTTTAGALAVHLADAGLATHLISTDPAHSVGDLFESELGGTPAPSPCTPLLTLEEFDAAATADAWLGRSLDQVTEIVEAGTYLDHDDVLAFSRLALPGLDEMMAVLRLSDLADAGTRVVVDTAPTGHTLRLLDAADTHEAVARALRAMADKAAVVAGSFAGRSVRLTGEKVIDELNRYVETFRTRVLGGAVFILTTGDEPVVAAETRRLRAELDRRGLNTIATVFSHRRSSHTSDHGVTGWCGRAPTLSPATGCAALRAWNVGLSALDVQRDYPAVASPLVSRAVSAPGTAAEWVAHVAPRLLLFAGKGGVGKSTCAAAAAVHLAGTRDVLLCSTDPAGSIDDVFDRNITGSATAGNGRAAGRLRALQIDPHSQFDALRNSYRDDVVDALERLGLGRSAELDRRVVEALWDLAPPGIDELAALSAMLNHAESDESIVFDTAPTGHFLRLLSMPDLALDWTRQLMRVVVKYGLAGSGGAAETLLGLSRELRALQKLLHDASGAAVVIVTLDDELVRAETERLLHSLHEAGISVIAVVTNRSDGPSGRHTAAGANAIAAPEFDAPVGEDALREFIASWKIVG